MNDLAVAPPGPGLDVVTAVMVALVVFLGLVILRFSRSYLRGDPGQPRHTRWLLVTLAAVLVLVVARDLLVLWLAWVATSLALHQLLTFYPRRVPALVAAHKKFLVSRVADLCVLGAIGLIAGAVGSLELDAVRAWAAAAPALPLAVEVAAVLLVLGACLKSAQLPFHGWLTQVMEAPTPVSALLHAGIVNIGGLLMIRLAPLMARAEAAQTLLVLVGCATAVVAALVMSTRVSVKVALAWSTIAQMGFMLVQCGLGAYHLALLHLVAHSLYKAHAFLGAGSAVEAWRAQALVARERPVGVGQALAGAAAALVGVGAVGAAFGVSPGREPALWALTLVLALALASLMARSTGGGVGRLVGLGLGGLAVAALYFTWHGVFGWLLPAVDAGGALGPRLAIVMVAFGGLFVVQAVVQARPDGRLARALYPRLFAGLHLDAWFTRLTFRLWRPRLPADPAPTVPLTRTVEA